MANPTNGMSDDELQRFKEQLRHDAICDVNDFMKDFFINNALSMDEANQAAVLNRQALDHYMFRNAKTPTTEEEREENLKKLEQDIGHKPNFAMTDGRGKMNPDDITEQDPHFQAMSLDERNLALANKCIKTPEGEAYRLALQEKVDKATDAVVDRAFNTSKWPKSAEEKAADDHVDRIFGKAAK